MNALLVVVGDIYTYKMALRVGNEEVALVALVYVLFSKTYVLMCLKTMTNSAESVLCMMALYYYSKLKYDKSLLYTRELVMLTTCVTLNFLVRSSSLMGWIPLILLAAMLSKRPVASFITLIQVGVTITIPLFLLSIAVDSLYYGRLVFTQFNFAYVNVV